MKKYLSPVMTSCAAAGLLCLLVVIVTNSAYPSPVFQIGTLVGLGLIFFSMLLLMVNWMMNLHRAIKGRQFAALFCLLVAALFFLFNFFRR